MITRNPIKMYHTKQYIDVVKTLATKDETVKFFIERFYRRAVIILRI